MLNITNIPAPRVPVVEPETGLISREWYRFFYNIFLLAGGGTNQTSIEDLQVAPPSQDLTTLIAKVAEYLGPPYEDQSGDFSATLSTAQLASMMAQFQTVVGDIQGAYLQPPVQVGTMSYQNSDNVYITGGYISGTTSGLTLGSIVFAGASGALSQNNANLFWDNTNLRLGIGLAAPSVLVHAAAASDAKFYLESTTSGAALFNLYAPNSGLAAYNAITSNYGATNSWYLGGDGNIDTMVFKTAGAERMRIASSGNVGIGTSSPASLLHVDGGTTTIQRYASSGAVILRSAAGTQASPTAITSSTAMGVVTARGYDGTAYRGIGGIQFVSDGAISSTSSPGYIQFLTTPSGSVSNTEVMRVTSVGNVYAASGTTGMTDGFFYIPAAAGAPTGVPTAVAGRVPMYYDTTNNKFYVYNGAWKSVMLL